MSIIFLILSIILIVITCGLTLSAASALKGMMQYNAILEARIIHCLKVGAKFHDGQYIFPDGHAVFQSGMDDPQSQRRAAAPD